MAKEYIAGKYGDALSYTGIHEMTTGMINGESYWEIDTKLRRGKAVFTKNSN